MDLRVCKIISFKFDIAVIWRSLGAILFAGKKMLYSARSSWFLYGSIADLVVV